MKAKTGSKLLIKKENGCGMPMAPPSRLGLLWVGWIQTEYTFRSRVAAKEKVDRAAGELIDHRREHGC